MKSRTSTGLLVLVVMAVLGLMLVYLPPQVIAQYDRVRSAGGIWVTVYFVVVGTGAVLFFGASGWILVRLWLRSRRKIERRARRGKNPSELTADQQRREVAENMSAVEDFKDDEAVPLELKQELEPLVRQLEEKQNDRTLEIVAFGSISCGKSSLLNALAGREVFQTDVRGGTTLRRSEVPWPGTDRVILVDTPGLGEVDGPEHAAESANCAQDADLVLVVVDGPLRESEFSLVERLASMEKRILVCLTKDDWYDERERDLLLGQLCEQVKAFVESDDVVSVRAVPAERSRVRITAAGEETTESIAIDPNIEPLASRMMAIVERDGSDLLLANLLLQSRGLVEDARQRVRDSLDARAWEIVEKYMWSAGGAAALSPLPIMDLVAGSAITTKMVLDLARVYRQEMDIESAVRLLGQLGKNLIAIVGVSAATPAIASAIATLLKTVPGAGTIAGGLLQGIVQALVTRWIGAVFIQYYKTEMEQPEGGLASLARREWQRLTTVDELRKLVLSAKKLVSS